MTFILEPQDIEVVIGNNAFFPCTYNGTRRVPHWVMDKITYSVSALPPGFVYNSTGLLAFTVDMSMNATKYKCCFEVHLGQGIINEICSSEGMLIINNAGERYGHV